MGSKEDWMFWEEHWNDDFLNNKNRKTNKLKNKKLRREKDRDENKSKDYGKKT
jgi:hypothetical protein